MSSETEILEKFAIMPRKELKVYAKRAGIKANLANTDLRRLLSYKEQGREIEAEYMKGKRLEISPKKDDAEPNKKKRSSRDFNIYCIKDIVSDIDSRITELADIIIENPIVLKKLYQILGDSIPELVDIGKLTLEPNSPEEAGSAYKTYIPEDIVKKETSLDKVKSQIDTGMDEEIDIEV